MADTADTQAANPDSGANQAGSLSVMEAAARFGEIVDEVDATEDQQAPEDDAPVDEQPEGATEAAPEVEVTIEEDEGKASDPKGEDGTAVEAKEPELFEVQVSGQSIKVNRDELIKGYQREADYRRKTQDLGVRHQELDQREKRLEEIIEKFDSMGSEEKEPDWNALMEEEPISAMQKFIEYEQRKRLREAAQKEAAKNEDERRREAEEAESQYRAREAAKLVQNPMFEHWGRDQRAAAQHQAKLRDYAVTQGVEPEEMSNLTDHRLIVLLEGSRRHDGLVLAAQGKAPDGFLDEIDPKLKAVFEKARQLDELVAQKSKVENQAKPAPKARKPGTHQADRGSRNEDKISDAMNRLTKSGSAKDAAAVMGMLK